MEETKTDTPQVANPNNVEAAFDALTENKFGANPTEGPDTSNLAVEDAFFEKTEDIIGVAPQQEQAPPVEETTPQDADAKNDERRFEYWQSQAAKRENELQALKQQVSETQQVAATQAPPEAAETVKEFPPPPLSPKKPARFSREEAWSDPSSESAKYLDEKESWDDDKAQYDELKHQYDMAVMQEKLDGQTTYIHEQEQQRQNRIEQGRQISKISEHVQGHYGLSPTETTEFIKTMSEPDSISMDNLVQLFRMNQTQGQPVQNPVGPSDTFRQERHAQQVPSPMGVLPAQSNQDVRTDENKIMDDLISNHKSKNPWT